VDNSQPLVFSYLPPAPAFEATAAGGEVRTSASLGRRLDHCDPRTRRPQGTSQPDQLL